MATEHADVPKHSIGLLVLSYVMFIGVTLTAWNNTISSTLHRINTLCTTVSAQERCTRVYVLALFAFCTARTFFLIAAGLTVMYFATQMLNILVEYMPSFCNPAVESLRLLSNTDYAFQAVEPATLPVHAAVIVLVLGIIWALSLFYLTDADLEHPDLLRQKLTYMILVLPVFVVLVYVALCILLIVKKTR